MVVHGGDSGDGVIYFVISYSAKVSDSVFSRFLPKKMIDSNN